MRTKIFLLLLSFVLIRGICTGQVASDTADIYRIETSDGNTFTGIILTEDTNTLVLRTERLGDVTIQQADVKSRTLLKNITERDGQLWLPNPQSSRYFWSPNGYGLEKGTGYYQNIWVLYNQASVGITDNFSLGLGTVPLFLFGGFSTPVWILPKLSLPVVRDKVNIGAGGLFATVLGESTGIFGLLYETTTLGPRDKNVSIGFAYGFAQDNWMKKPLINLGTMLRLSARSYFISDNYFIPSDDNYTVLMSLGGRSILGSIGLDYSLWIPIDSGMERFIALPFLGITIPLGKRSSGK
jgi:hypothetical protein